MTLLLRVLENHHLHFHHKECLFLQQMLLAWTKDKKEYHVFKSKCPSRWMDQELYCIHKVIYFTICVTTLTLYQFQLFFFKFIFQQICNGILHMELQIKIFEFCVFFPLRMHKSWAQKLHRHVTTLADYMKTHPI